VSRDQIGSSFSRGHLDQRALGDRRHDADVLHVPYWRRAAVRERPPRRYYTLTDEGVDQLGGILQRARSDSRFRAMNLRFA
jgi:hypothetical protein